MISLSQGDITKPSTMSISPEAIVNAANEALAPGAGVCGAIFAAAGVDELAAACAVLAPCPTGEAVVTPSFGLMAQGVRWIIHAVGPIYSARQPAEADELLAATYRSILDRAHELDCSSLAIPAISTGIYGFPARRAAKVAVEAIRERADSLDVVLVAFDDEARAILSAAL